MAGGQARQFGKTQVPFLLQLYHSQQHRLWQWNGVEKQKSRKSYKLDSTRACVSWKSPWSHQRPSFFSAPHPVLDDRGRGKCAVCCGCASCDPFLGWTVSQAGPLSRADKWDLRDISGLCSGRASPITNPHEGRAGLLFASVPTLPDKE